MVRDRLWDQVVWDPGDMKEETIRASGGFCGKRKTGSTPWTRTGTDGSGQFGADGSLRIGLWLGGPLVSESVQADRLTSGSSPERIMDRASVQTSPSMGGKNSWGHIPRPSDWEPLPRGCFRPGAMAFSSARPNSAGSL